jgi:hypothetical protein
VIDLEQVFDDSLALSTRAADSHVWGWMAGLLTADRVSMPVRRWVAYSAIVVGGDRFVTLLEEFVPPHEPGETTVVHFEAILRGLCAAYPSRKVAERRVKTWMNRYAHRMRSAGLLIPPPPAGNATRFVEQMYRSRARLLAELEERAA